MFRHFNITLNITKKSSIDTSLQKSFFTQRTSLGKVFFGGYFWLMHQFCTDSTTHTPTFQQFGNPFVACNLHASHLAVASSLSTHYRSLLERDVLLDKDSSDSNTPLFQRQCCNDNKFHLHWNNQFSFVYQYWPHPQFSLLVDFVESITEPYSQRSDICFGELWTS